MKAPYIRFIAVVSQIISVGLLGCGINSSGGAPTVTAIAPASKPVPTQVSVPVASPTASALIVGNTGGEGVFIRGTLSEADRIKAWADDTVMVVIGEDRQWDGRTWKNVRDPDGNEGWVPSEYLIAGPSDTPQATATASR